MPVAITTYWLNVYQMPGATLKSLDISECNVPDQPWFQHIANQTRNPPKSGEFALNQTDDKHSNITVSYRVIIQPRGMLLEWLPTLQERHGFAGTVNILK